MIHELNENFMAFCKFLGSGDINSKIWFVGIEEGGKTVTKKNISEQLTICKEETTFFPLASDNTPVWNIIAELLFSKYSNIHKLKDTEYRQKMFDEKYSCFFLTELFPLPRLNNSSWEENYTELFGYSQSDYFDYLSDVRSFRFPIIYKKWIEKRPTITICFGSTYRYEFINLFQLGHSRFINLPDTGILNYPKENILLCPFFNYRTIKNKERDILKELINKL
ncbi:MAG: hypothetical protein M0P61_06810 [Ignavibacteriaceae bacterium]|jgi:hypothetical protein|nr:hypothetical protein [Ignavibacteriaceae bacterium]